MADIDNLSQPQDQELVEREIIQTTPMLHGRRELATFDGKTLLAKHMTHFETSAMVNDWNEFTKAAMQWRCFESTSSNTSSRTTELRRTRETVRTVFWPQPKVYKNTKQMYSA